jgi:5'-methylthioadenosine phosphorylase
VAVPVGILTGSAMDALPELEVEEERALGSPWGPVHATLGRWCGADVVHVSRHGPGHVRLSNHVHFRGNAWVMQELGVTAVVGCTACGAVDPDLPLGSLVVFDDLHFPVNRLPDGKVCTIWPEAGVPHRGHWIFDDPYSREVRAALLGADATVPVRDGGCYGHVDGPRFNTKAEIRGLAAAGVTAVSQTGGPETVFLGELEIPFALVGYVTDYANGVRPDDPTPVEELTRLMGQAPGAFAAVLAGAVPALASGAPPPPVGTVYRFET